MSSSWPASRPRAHTVLHFEPTSSRTSLKAASEPLYMPVVIGAVPTVSKVEGQAATLRNEVPLVTVPAERVMSSVHPPSSVLWSQYTSRGAPLGSGVMRYTPLSRCPSSYSVLQVVTKPASCPQVLAQVPLQHWPLQQGMLPLHASPALEQQPAFQQQAAPVQFATAEQHDRPEQHSVESHALPF